MDDRAPVRFRRALVTFAMALALQGVAPRCPEAAIATRVVAGQYHTCALTAVGGVECWGINATGQIGDGTETYRRKPQEVHGLTSGVAALAAGDLHTCALTTAGGVKCWGFNRYGQLGDGTTTDRLTPVDVIGLASGVAAITVGELHTCAVTTDGGMKCWGWNFHGQLGDGTTTDRDTPVDVNGLTTGVSAIAAGGTRTCALTTGGGVKCWGTNSHGQVGDGTATERLTPVDVNGLASGVAAITAGPYHTCALTTGGGAKCWGDNSAGQLGNGVTAWSSPPVDVSGLTSGVAAIDARGAYTCALTTSGGVQCWGYNGHGQLGDGTTLDHHTPADVNGLTSGIAAIAVGHQHACALTNDGGIRCWGDNTFGQVGDGTLNRHPTPVDVSGLSSGPVAIAASLYQTCAVTEDGGAQCWGGNNYSQLGDGTTTDRHTPVDVNGLTSGVDAITAGYYHSCALTTAGGMQCWGYNYYGQLGDGTTTNRSTAVNVSGLTSGVAAIDAGDHHTCALTTDGGARCWGKNQYGELGDGTTTNRRTAVDVSGLTSGVAAVAAGNSYTCALTAAGGVKCWGYNGSGQLGDGTTTDRRTPVDVSGLTSGVAAIAAGIHHTCALTTAGGAKCWGYNLYGALGDGTTTDHHTPVDVSGLTSGVVAITAGWFYTCALTTDGGVKCWGDNGHSQLGDGTTMQRRTPVDVSGLTSGVTAIAAGVVHTCALIASGGAKCWGDGSNGELGNGDAGNYLEPRTILGFGPDCGNGTLDDWEDCDDGNVTSSDGCSATCGAEVCGNGILDAGETCDDGNLVAGDGCTPACVAEICGNEILDAGETCDDGNVVAGDGCSPRCATEVCGNGIVDFGEMCDDGNLAAGDGCTPGCVAEICGNSVLDAGEICDDGNLIAGDGCSSTCALELCGVAPMSGCVNAAQAQLQIREKTPGKAKLDLQWKRFATATTPNAFGDPVHGTTGVALCLYSDAETLVQGYLIDRAAQLCSGSPCWASTTTGHAYADKTASTFGITLIRVGTGDAGKGRASARGANNVAKGQLELPTNVAAALASEQHPTMQLVTSDGLCVSTTLSEVLKADGITYKARKR